MSFEDAQQDKFNELWSSYAEAKGSIIPTGVDGIGDVDSLLRELSNDSASTPYIDGLVFAGKIRSTLTVLIDPLNTYLFKTAALDLRKFNFQVAITNATTETDLDAIVIDFSDILVATYPEV